MLRATREAKLEPNPIPKYGDQRVCEKGEQWQRALALLGEMREVTPEPDPNVLGYSTSLWRLRRKVNRAQRAQLLSEI
ncbi:unnamed protein product [Prorocentrum cordatum]|uniref:Uncharacterized protein n=1 Tax=Prorocentrum cordatum TaxID=2364126 RepID=A0ABN9QCA1_9DINO|nr:unnamed protein product [Polarella glacialis]